MSKRDYKQYRKWQLVYMDARNQGHDKNAAEAAGKIKEIVGRGK